MHSAHTGWVGGREANCTVRLPKNMQCLPVYSGDKVCDVYVCTEMAVRVESVLVDII